VKAGEVPPGGGRRTGFSDNDSPNPALGIPHSWEHPVHHDNPFWRWYGLPVLLSVTIFSGLNALWNQPGLGDHLGAYLPYTVTVYLLGGSGLALAILWRSIRARLLTPNDLGLGLSGWTPPRRLVSLAAILTVIYWGYATLPSRPQSPADPAPAARAAAADLPDGDRTPADSTPTWGEYGFWFVTLLSASQAELLVFVGVGFCLMERWLRGRGLGRLLSNVLAGLPTCVAFGLYHYTHEPRWHQYSLTLMWEMLIVLVFFVATRNFFRTLVLHNAFAAVGFTTEAHLPVDPISRAHFAEPWALSLNLLSFLIPFLLLHALEWKGWPRIPGDRSELPAGSNVVGHG
jgi:hypothetical protein